MTRPLSNDLRERVIEAIEGGLSRRAASERFGVAVSSAIKWHRRWRETGSVRPLPQGGDKRSHRIEAHRDGILALVEDKPDITLAEIADYLAQNHGLGVAQSTVWRFLHRHRMTFKKNRACRRTGAS